MIFDVIKAQKEVEKCDCGMDVWTKMVEDMGVPVIVVDPKTNKVVYSSPGAWPGT